jgi:5-methylcytosine-specific restriction protein A
VYGEACGFDFEETDGERGKGFIECHHVKPLHTLKPGEKTSVDDLMLLCSNCRRMVHTKSSWLTVAAHPLLRESQQPRSLRKALEPRPPRQVCTVMVVS